MNAQFNPEEINVNYGQPCILIGGSSQYKTTFLLHYAYIKSKECKNEVEYGIVICSQLKLDKEDRLIFGRKQYQKQIQPQITNTIKLKYIETYAELCKFLQVLPLIDSCPKYVFIDDINLYVGQDHRKLGFLLLLLRNVSTFITSRQGNTNNFNVFATYQIDSMDSELYLRDKPEITENDINLSKIKQKCLLFKVYSQNLFQIQITQNDQKVNLYKVYQDYTSLKMHKCQFTNKEFTEILNHIKGILVSKNQISQQDK
ncbi:hypothetical protein TTHERM_00304200 (macronuclear) [Tetrahymena thermophila SB210]|uniref:Uncharacterized protein n=1 Tax=Tetrahymena thermophila (strain SB210) TaxID=312017 RepID=I7MFX1_TETTS|nr:hypothetical protein TTHERM_00304200 [Tetrahymena thermophila SB210]EAS00752.2 hypothetical protein TTHERM_00304200 [Tetrahymena thermophila SB210]|eukprot:XP_001020997.2 hypothetical protein TTHERM_00304200 [Tetrahymena thermophila SB210]